MKKYLSVALMAALLSGCGMSASEKMVEGEDGPNAFNYDCNGVLLAVTVNQALAQARILVDGKVRLLPQVIAASGARYDDGQYVFWSKGDKASVYRDGALILDNCELKD